MTQCPFNKYCRSTSLIKKCRGLKPDSRNHPGGSVVKNPPANAEYMGLIPGSGSSPGEGNGHPHQYSCPENSKDRGAWWATVHRVAVSLT